MLRLTEEEAKKWRENIEKKEEELKELGKYKASAYENEGDGFHDNFAFEQAEIKERGLLNEIAKLKKELDESEIVEHKPNESGKVTLGSKVTLLLKYEGEPQEVEESYTVTGGNGNIMQHLISENSPMAMCIMNKPVGYEGEFVVGTSRTEVKIVKIE